MQLVARTYTTAAEGEKSDRSRQKIVVGSIKQEERVATATMKCHQTRRQHHHVYHLRSLALFATLVIFTAIYILTLMAAVSHDHELLLLSNTPNNKSRRLSAEYALRKPALHPWIEPPFPLITGYAWDATTIQWVGNSFYFTQNKNNNKMNHNIHNDMHDGGDINAANEHSSYSSATNTPLYTPHQIQKAFRHHSIVLQGDSTIRRLYGTLHGILSYDVESGSMNSRLFPKGFPEMVPQSPFGMFEHVFFCDFLLSLFELWSLVWVLLLDAVVSNIM